jgi:hypothetical protein
MTAYISAPDLDFYLEVVDATPDEVQARVAELMQQQAAIAVGPGGGSFINFAALKAVRVTGNSPAEWIAYSIGGNPKARVEINLKDLEKL